MVFVNEAYKVDALPVDYLTGFVQLLAPLAPHLAEELWEKLGHTESVQHTYWPQYDERLLVEEEVDYVFQVNGKIKARAAVPFDADREAVTQLAMADAAIQEAIQGKEIVKTIVVPGKLVNIVVR